MFEEHNDMSFELIGFASTENGPSDQQQAMVVDPVKFELVLQTLISDRRKRGHQFAAELFSDPAWDILLVLALATTRQQRLCVSRLCERLDVPMTTLLRWLTRLESKGLIYRREDIFDRRRTYVELSRTGYRAMAAFCSTSSAHLAVAA